MLSCCTSKRPIAIRSVPGWRRRRSLASWGGALEETWNGPPKIIQKSRKPSRRPGFLHVLWWILELGDCFICCFLARFHCVLLILLEIRQPIRAIIIPFRTAIINRSGGVGFLHLTTLSNFINGCPVTAQNEMPSNQRWCYRHNETGIEVLDVGKPTGVYAVDEFVVLLAMKDRQYSEGQFATLSTSFFFTEWLGVHMFSRKTQTARCGERKMGWWWGATMAHCYQRSRGYKSWLTLVSVDPRAMFTDVTACCALLLWLKVPHRGAIWPFATGSMGMPIPLPIHKSIPKDCICFHHPTTHWFSAFWLPRFLGLCDDILRHRAPRHAEAVLLGNGCCPMAQMEVPQSAFNLFHTDW